MLIPLLLLASLNATPGGVVSDQPDPPIHVSLNSDARYVIGDRSKVYVQAADDGYLVVLRADVRGNVRVLWPLDPDDEQQVRGHKKFEVKGRGGREAFAVEDTAGQGLVLAAWSKTPFNVERFNRNGHWDYAALSGTREGLSSEPDDPESRLLSVMDSMKSPGDRTDYDVATYMVASPQLAGPGYGPYAWPGWWGYDPWWGGPRFSGRFVLAPRGFGYRRWW